MLPSDRPEFLKILNGLSAIKPNKALTPEALDLWWSSMLDWRIEDFRAAANHLARSMEFMPNPFSFEQLRRAALPTPAEAFARAVRHAASSAYRKGPLGDQAIDIIVQGLGGYLAIAMCDEDKLPFLERRFAEHYETQLDRAESRGDLPNLLPRRISGPRHLLEGK